MYVCVDERERERETSLESLITASKAWQIFFFSGVLLGQNVRWCMVHGAWCMVRRTELHLAGVGLVALLAHTPCIIKRVGDFHTCGGLGLQLTSLDWTPL